MQNLGKRAIIKIKVTQNIIFPEARRFVGILFIKSTFAIITKTSPNPNENQVNAKIKKEWISLIKELKDLIKTLKTTMPNIKKNLCQ